MVVIWLLFLAFIIAIGVGLIFLFWTFAKWSIIFSNISFGIFIGFGLSHYTLIPSNATANTVLWMVLVVGMVYLLSLLPWVKHSIKFFTTAFVSYLAFELLGFFVISFVDSLASISGNSFAPSIASEIFIKVVCIFVSFGALTAEIKKKVEAHALPSMPKMIDIALKALASIIYGSGLLFLISTSANNIWSFSPVVKWCLFLVFTAVAFIVNAVILDRKTK